MCSLPLGSAASPPVIPPGRPFGLRRRPARPATSRATQVYLGKSTTLARSPPRCPTASAPGPRHTWLSGWLASSGDQTHRCKTRPLLHHTPSFESPHPKTRPLPGHTPSFASPRPKTRPLLGHTPSFASGIHPIRDLAARKPALPTRRPLKPAPPPHHTRRQPAPVPSLPAFEPHIRGKRASARPATRAPEPRRS